MSNVSHETGRAENKPGNIDIRNGRYGFHYTRDEELADLLRHGLISRMEERRRGLKVHRRASRSMADTIYFTTEPDELYLSTVFSGPEDQSGDSHESQLEHAVGIVIDRPEFAYARTSGHFGMRDSVSPHDFRALLIIDREGVSSHGGILPGKPNHTFGDMKDPAWVGQRVAVLRSACQEAGLDIPIVGISGTMYSS